MSKVLSLNDIRELRTAFMYDDLSADSQTDLIDTAERYASAILKSWSVQNYCKYCGAIIQEWPLVGTNTGPVCHHDITCVVMQIKGMG